jgi:hypothetical protein
LEASHTRELATVPATGRPVEIRGINIFLLEFLLEGGADMGYLRRRL